MNPNFYDKRINALFGRARSKPVGLKVNNQNDIPELLIYDYIGWLGVESEDFVKKLSSIDSDQINIRINSPGGSVFDGVAIYNAIKQHSANITIYIDSLAASIASVIALAGDRIVMANNGFFMIHNAWGLCIGNKHEMRDVADLLEQIDDEMIIDTYLRHSNLEKDEIIDYMDNETFFSGKKALAAGFVDELMDDEVEDDEQNSFDLSIYNNVPDALKGKKKQKPKPPESKREFESFLRDVGYSHIEAKKIISEGFNNFLRDVENDHRDDEELKIDLTSINDAIEAFSTN